MGRIWCEADTKVEPLNFDNYWAAKIQSMYWQCWIKLNMEQRREERRIVAANEDIQRRMRG